MSDRIYRTETEPRWPEGITWQDAESARTRLDMPQGMLPLGAAPGVVAWGYPLASDCEARPC